MLGSQLGSVSCPVCRAPLNVQPVNIIDAEKQPEMKVRLLQGAVNAFRCPNCGNAGVLQTPLLYHDGSKQILFAFTPANLSMKSADSQKMIGSLTNALMSSLAPEKRKAYLFQPKTFLTHESLMQAILEADGITKEMIEGQKARVKLLNDLAAVRDNDEQIKQIVSENQALIDAEFFDILGSLVETAHMQGQSQTAQSLLTLRQRLLPLTEVGRKALEAENRMREELQATKAELLKRMLETRDQTELDDLVRTGRAFMDYAFFQEIADKIEASPRDAKRLTQRRSDILAISERQDEEDRKMLGERAEFLKKILQAADPATALRSEPGLLDDAFFTVLQANVQAAARAGQTQAVNTLQRLGSMAMEVIRDNAPPMIKLVNSLLEAETAEERQKLLDGRPELITSELADTLRVLVDEMGARGQVEAVERLRAVLAQTEALLTREGTRK